MQAPSSCGGGGAGSFSDDPELDAEFEALVKENEMMLIEIHELRRRVASSEAKVEQLQELCDTLAQEKRDLQDVYSAAKEDDEEENWHEKYDNLYNEYVQLVNAAVEENHSVDLQPVSDAGQRIERVLKELRTFSNSHQMSIGHLKRCGIIPSTVSDKVPSECQKNLSMLQKLVESARRLTTVVPGDDELVVLVKGLVGEVTLAGALALQETLTTFGNVLGISNGVAASPGGGHQDPSASSANSAKVLSFWRGK